MILRSKVKPSVRICWHLLNEATGNGGADGFIGCYSLNLAWWPFCFLLRILLVWTCELITFMNDSAWSCDHMGFCIHCWRSHPIIFSEARRAAFEDSAQSNSKAANSYPALKIFKQKQFSWRSYKYQGEECRHKTLQKWLKTRSEGLVLNWSLLKQTGFSSPLYNIFWVISTWKLSFISTPPFLDFSEQISDPAYFYTLPTRRNTCICDQQPDGVCAHTL